MKQNLNAEITRSIQDFRFPKYHEIPDVGLFLEQVAKYISSFLEPLGDITVTGSMISNYVKKDLVDNPIKKQYYRDQIAYLIFISMALSTSFIIGTCSRNSSGIGFLVPLYSLNIS